MDSVIEKHKKKILYRVFEYLCTTSVEPTIKLPQIALESFEAFVANAREYLKLSNEDTNAIVNSTILNESALTELEQAVVAKSKVSYLKILNNIYVLTVCIFCFLNIFNINKPVASQVSRYDFQPHTNPLNEQNYLNFPNEVGFHLVTPIQSPPALLLKQNSRVSLDIEKISQLCSSVTSSKSGNADQTILRSEFVERHQELLLLNDMVNSMLDGRNSVFKQVLGDIKRQITPLLKNNDVDSKKKLLNFVVASYALFFDFISATPLKEGEVFEESKRIASAFYKMLETNYFLSVELYTIADENAFLVSKNYCFL